MNQPGEAHGSQLRKARVSLPDQAYYVTKNILPKHGPVLSADNCAEVIVSTFLWAQESQWLRVLGFVVMPDHYHIAFALRKTKTLSQVMHGIDRYTARRINGLLSRRGQFWQEGFYEHALRSRADFDGILMYMHDNPVRAGLIHSAEIWPFSTANPVYAPAIDWEWLGHSMPR